jgi:hypothetical protein
MKELTFEQLTDINSRVSQLPMDGTAFFTTPVLQDTTNDVKCGGGDGGGPVTPSPPAPPAPPADYDKFG